MTLYRSMLLVTTGDEHVVALDARTGKVIGPLLTPRTPPGQASAPLYTNATLTLNPDPGKLSWHYQHFARDVWDLDRAFEQTLAVPPIDGKLRRVIVTIGKIGLVDIVHAQSGRFQKSYDLRLQNIVDPAKWPTPAHRKRSVPMRVAGAHWLVAQGVKPGDRVAFMLNPTEVSTSTCSAHCARARFGVPLFALFGPEGLRLRVNDCAPSISITNSEKANAALGIDLLQVVVADDAWIRSSTPIRPTSRAKPTPATWRSSNKRRAPPAIFPRRRSTSTVPSSC